MAAARYITPIGLHNGISYPFYWYQWERLSHLNLFSFEKLHLRGKRIECFKLLKDFTNVNATKLFMMHDSLRTRSNGSKHKCKQVNLDGAKYSFTNAVVDWNRLPPSVVLQCSSKQPFENRLDSYLLHQNAHYVIYSVMVAAWYFKFRLRMNHLEWVLRPVWSGFLCNSM